MRRSSPPRMKIAGLFLARIIHQPEKSTRADPFGGSRILNTRIAQVIILLKHALQKVLTVSRVVSAPRSGALRLGSLRGPTTTAWPLLPRGGRVAHQGYGGR